MAEKADVTYIFGEFSLNPAHRSFGKDGQEIHLPAKEFDTLLFFVENQGRVLSKDEMLSAIWEDTFVEEGNLAQYVSRLRKLLNTNGSNYIQTLPKKGYRFDADVKVIRKEELSPVKSNRNFVIAGVIGLLLLIAAVFVAFLFRNKPASAAKPSARNQPVLLTDGKQNDGPVEWTSDNHIRFFRRTSPGRYEAWIMNLNGSDSHREVPPIKGFLNGFWSPDGKKVYFMKEGDSQTTYLANSDGSDEIALPLLVGNSDWSPDSSKIVYETRVGETTEIYLYTIETRQNVNLTRNNYFDADPSFAPDGQHIVYLSSPNDNADIYMMDLNGENVRRLTDHPAFDNFPSVSPDGTQLLFRSNRDGGEARLYIRNLNDDSPPVPVTDFSGIEGAHARCWSPDGTQLVVASDVSGKDQIILLNVDPYKAEPLIKDEAADLQFPRVSPDGSKLLYQARLADHSIELRVTDLTTKTTSTIYKTSTDIPVPFLVAAQWSPDGSRIVFSNKIGNTNVFSIKSDGSDLKQLTDDSVPDVTPVYSADGKEIYFSRDFYGKAKVYRMSVDGGDAEPLTTKFGYELSPAVSPDGKTMLLSIDRVDGKSRGLDIYSIDLTQPENERQLTFRRSHEASVVFSPDGKRIAFVANSDDNPEIYVANADGSGLFRLTRNKANDGAPTFSADGKRIIFSSDREGKFAIYEVELPN
jgi:Tol biopolymer transport system component/DNA-binding winged helix-turn-helix (wHTH) protein